MSVSSPTLPSMTRLVMPLVLVAVLALGGCTTQPSASPSTAAPTSVATEPAPPSAVTLTPSPGGSIAASLCLALSVQVTSWTGATGHRIATVELQNLGPDPCTLPALMQPQLVDGNGAVLIDVSPPGVSEAMTVASGGVLRTMVQDSNYCGPAPVPPVSIAFLIPGLPRVVASPLTSTDTSGLPPCLGLPGSAGTVEMQPWAP